MTSYLRFSLANARFLAFGTLAATLSGFGQTFYIAIFGGELRAAFDLTHGEYGLLYSLATLGSGLLIIWAGRQLDRMPLPRFVTFVGLGVALGCLLLASAQTAVMLGLALFLLRFCGQGLFTHVSATSMGRYFDANRGKAVSIAAKGLPLGEAIMPAIAVALIAAIGWRQTWYLSAAFMLLLAIPLLLWLLRGQGRREEAHMAHRRSQAEEPGVNTAARQWTRAEVLRDPRFYRVLPVMMAAPLTVTGMLFHLAALADGKGWSMGWLAGSFTGFALAHVAGLLVAGPLLDRHGARPLLRGFLWPMAAGLAIVATVDQPAAAWLFMALMGLSLGGAATLLGALWPQLYGVAHLGAIRALVHATLILSTAITPVAIGVALDGGLSMEAIALMLAGYLVGATVLAWTAVAPRPQAEKTA
ncbi:MFS transporter [Guyparkeria halopsychrophila]|uniref:MFS transporter n=1 Tax=Guyparkeria halopsychrophila TaxID=3139421 RepID=UPI0037CA4CD3